MSAAVRHHELGQKYVLPLRPPLPNKLFVEDTNRAENKDFQDRPGKRAQRILCSLQARVMDWFTLEVSRIYPNARTGNDTFWHENGLYEKCVARKVTDNGVVLKSKDGRVSVLEWTAVCTLEKGVFVGLGESKTSSEKVDNKKKPARSAVKTNETASDQKHGNKRKFLCVYMMQEGARISHLDEVVQLQSESDEKGTGKGKGKTNDDGKERSSFVPGQKVPRCNQLGWSLHEIMYVVGKEGWQLDMIGNVKKSAEGKEDVIEYVHQTVERYGSDDQLVKENKEKNENKDGKKEDESFQLVETRLAQLEDVKDAEMMKILALTGKSDFVITRFLVPLDDGSETETYFKRFRTMLLLSHLGLISGIEKMVLQDWTMARMSHPLAILIPDPIDVSIVYVNGLAVNISFDETQYHYSYSLFEDDPGRLCTEDAATTFKSYIRRYLIEQILRPLNNEISESDNLQWLAGVVEAAKNYGGSAAQGLLTSLSYQYLKNMMIQSFIGKKTKHTHTNRHKKIVRKSEIIAYIEDAVDKEKMDMLQPVDSMISTINSGILVLDDEKWEEEFHSAYEWMMSTSVRRPQFVWENGNPVHVNENTTHDEQPLSQVAYLNELIQPLLPPALLDNNPGGFSKWRYYSFQEAFRIEPMLARDKQAWKVSVVIQAMIIEVIVALLKFTIAKVLSSSPLPSSLGKRKRQFLKVLIRHYRRWKPVTRDPTVDMEFEMQLERSKVSLDSTWALQIPTDKVIALNIMDEGASLFVRPLSAADIKASKRTKTQIVMQNTPYSLHREQNHPNLWFFDRGFRVEPNTKTDAPMRYISEFCHVFLHSLAVSSRTKQSEQDNEEQTAVEAAEEEEGIEEEKEEKDNDLDAWVRMIDSMEIIGQILFNQGCTRNNRFVFTSNDTVPLHSCLLNTYTDFKSLNDCVLKWIAQDARFFLPATTPTRSHTAKTKISQTQKRNTGASFSSFLSLPVESKISPSGIGNSGISTIANAPKKIAEKKIAKKKIAEKKIAEKKRPIGERFQVKDLPAANRESYSALDSSIRLNMAYKEAIAYPEEPISKKRELTMPNSPQQPPKRQRTYSLTSASPPASSTL